MDENVAEGISTSLQTRPPVSQPSDLQGLASSLSHSPVNDLGLTPPPALQLTQSSGFQEIPYHEDVDATENSIKRREPGQSSWYEDVRSFYDINRPDFSDPIFDSGSALQMFEDPLRPQKRTNSEAFLGEFDWLGTPEKKRILELPQTRGLSPPGEAPSLSSPDSSYRPDQFETVPNTPADAREQTPDSLFESLDSLEDYASATASAETIRPSDFEKLPSTPGDVRITHDATSYGDVNMPSEIGATHSVSDATISASDLTKQRFSINRQNLTANALREMLHQVDARPGYISPHPLHRGPLGYLPSSPGIHVKFVHVSEDRTVNRVNNLKAQVKKLRYERDKYKAAWSVYVTVDEATGKTKDKLLLEENSSLRRASSKHRGQAEIYKRAEEEWRNRFNDLAITYNNLLLEFQAQRRVIIAPPLGYTDQPGRLGTAGNTVLQQDGQSQITSYPVMGQHAATYPALEANPPTLVRPTKFNPTASDTNPATIDLTEDRPRENPQNGPALLQSLRNKAYSWLNGAGGAPGHGSSQRSSGTNDGRQGNDGDDDLAREMEEELARAH